MGHKYSKILPCGPQEEAALLLGSIDWLVEDEILDELKVSAIVSVLPHQPQYVEEVLQKHGIPVSDYMLYPLEDSADEYISLFDAPGILNTCQFIHTRRLEGKTVLVHCDAGITRSPTVVVSYIMKYGLILHEPKPMSLASSLAHVRELRERVDVCAFHAELQRLEGMIGKGPAEFALLLSDRNANISFPRTPLSARSWSELRQEGDPVVELKLLQDTWQGIRRMDGGQAGFGLAVYKTLFANSGDHTRNIFARVDVQRLGLVMARMLHQIVWCLDMRNMDKLVKFHRHLEIQTEDLDAFYRAIVQTLQERLRPSPEALESWDRFLRVVFDRWAKIIHVPPLPKKEEYAGTTAPEPPKLAPPPKRGR
jgi:hypothetical protein